ncbi:MAG: hypothetical protein IPN83_00050 [Holophagales bacterium]|nr:hypothetical protein [Holophagales bacterium]
MSVPVLGPHDCETCGYPMPAENLGVQRDGHVYCGNQCATGQWISPGASITILEVVDTIEEASALFSGEAPTV